MSLYSGLRPPRQKIGDKGLAIIGIVLGGLMLVAFLIALGTVV